MNEAADHRDPLYWRTIGPWWKRISIYDGGALFLRQFAAAPEAVGHLFAAHWLQSEVRNGGFGQFFSNSTGVLAPEAERGFRAIGMPMAADVIASQIASFGPAYPREQDDRELVLEKRDRVVNRLIKTGNLIALAVRGRQMPPGDEAFWGLLKEENGGFLAAADRFALENDPDLA
ncbi:MAG: DMP19 family protein [Brevundimonas sp.]|nr:DMP19 family protein [Brevundimonas sp.]